jgi:Cu/Zn superoxide dismutase
MASVAELGARPIAIATFDTVDVQGSVSFLPELPGAGVHVFASLFFLNKEYWGKTLGMHIHSRITNTHFTAGAPNSRHGAWPDGHAGDLHNNIIVTAAGHTLLSFVDNRVSVDRGRPDCILYHNVVIHSGADNCGIGLDPCSASTGCAGKILAAAQIVPWGSALCDACC